MSGRVFCILSAAILFLCLVLGEGAAGTVYVDANATGDGSGSDWSNACTTVAAGLALAATGDEVWVKSGTYEEAVIMPADVGLYGGFPAAGFPAWQDRDWSANVTVIDATGLNASVVVGNDGAALDGFTVTGGNAGSGGGIYCVNGSFTVANCVITGNEASFAGGGAYFRDSFSTFINCVISGNIADIGGAVSSRYSSRLRLVNCTMAGNSTYRGGTVACCTGEITNSILWNVGKEILHWPDCEGPIEVNSSCVEGLWPGQGNIDADPLFVDPEGGDYRLRNGSPCVDRGLVSAAPPVDIAGRPRPGGDGLVDIGAYESPDAWEPGTPPAEPGIIHVRADATGGGDGSSWTRALRTIGAAVPLASASTEIWVASGRYHEPVVLEREAAVCGGFAGWETSKEERDIPANETVIDATGFESSAVDVTKRAVLDGLTITGASGWFTAGVRCIQASVTIRNCTVTANNNSGVDLGFVSSADLQGCVISENLAGHGGGISCSSASTATVQDCTIVSNRTRSSGGGVYCENNSSITFQDCLIANNTAESGWGGGVYCWEDCSAEFTDCTISRNHPDGLEGWIRCSAGFLRCEVTDNDGPGVRCYEGPVEFEDCVIRGNEGCAVECDGPTLTMKGCLVSENASQWGGGIWSGAASAVLESCTIARNSPGGGLGFSGGSMTELIDDSVTLTDCLITENGMSAERLDVLFLENCRFSDNSDAGGRSGGLYTSEVAVATMRDCTFEGNSGRVGGGAWIGAGTLEISRCSFEDNSADYWGGGAALGAENSGVVTDCRFTGNSANVGGGVSGGDGVRFTRCLVEGNTATQWGGGILGRGRYTECTFRGNTAEEGGALYSSGPPALTLTNCVLTGNTATARGGAAFCGSGSAPRFENCTITGNSAPEGGALFVDWAEPTLVNCILWDDPPAEIADPYYEALVSWSNVMRGWSGEGNIDATPEFVHPWDGLFGDYHLLPGSPCIDAGSNEAAAGIPLDMDGNVRIWDGDVTPGAVVDMGSYEFGSVSPTPTPTPSPTPTVSPTPIPGDTTGDGMINANDLFFFSQWWQQAENETNFRCDCVDDGLIDEDDLLRLIGRWNENALR